MLKIIIGTWNNTTVCQPMPIIFQNILGHTFVKEGVKSLKKITTSSQLESVSDWEMRIDWGRKQQIRGIVLSTTLRPDVKKIVDERTVPWEWDCTERKTTNTSSWLTIAKLNGNVLDFFQERWATEDFRHRQ